MGLLKVIDRSTCYEELTCINTYTQAVYAERIYTEGEYIEGVYAEGD
jgi:hypothetical protein